MRESSWTTPPTCEDFSSLQLGPKAIAIKTGYRKDQELPATWFLPALVARTEKPQRPRPQEAVRSAARLPPQDFKSLIALLGLLRGQGAAATVGDEP